MEKNRVAIDGLIFELQRIGGISRVWANIIRQFEKKGRIYDYIENVDVAQANAFRRDLDINPAHVRGVNRNSRLAKYWTKSGPWDVYVPTYYKYVPPTKKSIQVCHDLMPEKIHSGLMKDAIVCGRRLIYGAASKIICISNATRQDFLDFYPEFEAKLVVIGNPVDFSEIDNSLENYVEPSRGKNGLHALYVGNRSGFKNFWDIERLFDAVPDLVLSVVGPNLTANESDRLISKGNANRINFLGTLSNAQLYRLLREADFLFFPSINEGFGLPLVESLYVGTPVIGRNIAVNIEVSKGHVITYDEGSNQSMQSAVQLAIDFKLNTKNQFSAIRSDMSSYDAGAVADAYWELIQSV